jgi:hypothetical protein
MAPNSVATVLVLEGSDPPVTPEEVRDALKESYDNEGIHVRLGTKPKDSDDDDEGSKPKDNKGKGKKSKDKKGKKSKK